MSIQTAGAVPPLTLPWRLRMALEHAKMTQQDMADELGVSRATLSGWITEPERRTPRRAFLKQWALRTGVDYAWLAGGGVGPAGLEPTTSAVEGPHFGRQAWLRPMRELAAVAA